MSKKFTLELTGTNCRNKESSDKTPIPAPESS